MAFTNIHDNRQPAGRNRSSAHENSGSAIAMPAVPALVQLKRDREEDEALLQAPAQLKIKATAPAQTRIVIDNLAAGDFGDTGRIVRDSRKTGRKVVEFDNEPGVYYRVRLEEMSPVNEADQAYADGVSSAVKQLAQPVNITASINMGDPVTANFEAFNGEHKIGKLELENSDDGLRILSIYTNLSEHHGVKGLGTAFLNIAAIMAKKLGKAAMLLAAHKQKAAEAHPGPFYARFGFTSGEIVDAEQIGMAFGEYLTMLDEPTIEMHGNTQEVGVKTSAYLQGLH